MIKSYNNAFVHNGRAFPLPCGSKTYDAKESMKTNFRKRIYQWFTPVAESITWPSTLCWIKNLAFKEMDELCEEPSWLATFCNIL